MKKIDLTACLTVLFIFFIFCKVYSQPWMENFGDRTALNFYQIQTAFYDYWQDKDSSQKGAGWKQFKRWEWFWKPKVYPTGEFPNPMQVYKESKAFEQSKGNNDELQNIHWRFIGPSESSGGYRGLGRINVVRTDPQNNRIIWAGSASGGLWLSTNGGDSWSTKTDNLSSLGISDIAINPDNPEEIYIATGDTDWGYYYSAGVLKSTDKGNTWNTTGLNWQISQTRLIGRLLIDPANTETLYAACDNGIYKTTNAGTDWTKINNSSFYKPDMEFKPNDMQTIYISGKKILKTTDGGNTWTQLNNGFPSSGIGRIALGITPDSVSFVYALVAGTNNAFIGLYRSTNSGNSWELMSDSPNILGWSPLGDDNGGQGHYDLCIEVDQFDANTIYAGGINVWKSTDGGQDWDLNTMWYDIGSGVPVIHADQHDLRFVPNTNIMLCGNDGGVYKTTNGGDSWSWIGSGLEITQFYRLGSANSDFDMVVAGCQDNGTKLVDGNNWRDLLGGDGTECFIDYENKNVIYISTQNGGIRKSTDRGSTFIEIKNNIDEEGAWITPFVMHPENHNTIYAGYENIWMSTNGGNQWAKLSDFTGGRKLQHIEISPSNYEVIYTASYNNLYRTTDGGNNWIRLNRPVDLAVSDIAVHSNNPDKIWITVSGFNASNKVFKSEDGGQNWDNITGNLPNVPANTIYYQKYSPDRIFAGMETGVYYKDIHDDNWSEAGNGLPNVIINELEIHECAGKLRAATYGRGLWEAMLPNAMEAVELTAPENNSDKNPPNDLSLEWKKNTYADVYHLQVAANSSMSNLVIEEKSIKTNQFTLNGLDAFTEYFWRVQAVNGCSESDWSIINKFETFLDAPELLEPADKSKGIVIKPELAWKEIKDAQSYHIQIALDNEFKEIIFDSTNIEKTYVNIFDLDYYTSYFWRVSSVLNTKESIWSDVFSFTTIIAPPKLESPGNFNTAIPTEGIFKWDSVEGAEKYHIQLASKDNFSEIILERYVDSNSAEYSKLNFNKNFHWRVRSKNQISESDWSQPHSFITVLNEPVLFKPPNGTKHLPTDYEFGWKFVDGANRFDLRISSNEDMSEPIVDMKNIRDTREEVSGLDNYTLYYWQVKAKNDTNESEWADKITFRTIVGQPELVMPANYASSVGKKLRFEWKQIEGGNYYHFEISTDSNFKSTIFYIRTNKNYANYDKLETDTKYYWRVQAENDGVTGDWSDIWTFSTQITIPNLISPANSSTNIPSEGKLEWEDILNVSDYSLQLDDSPEFNSPEIKVNNLKKSEYSYSELNFKTKYFWKVKAEGIWGEGEWSDTYNFTTGLNVPDLIHPPNQSRAVSVSGKFRWQEVPFANSYNLQLSEDKQISNLIRNYNNIKNTEIEYKELEHYTTYYWRVQAVSNDQKADWSNINEFTTKLLPPTLLNPTYDQKNLPVNLTFSWSEVPGSEYYTLHLSEQRDFDPTLIEAGGIENTLYEVSDLNYDSVYYWRVRANEDDGSGEWSLSGQFKTKNSPSDVAHSEKPDIFLKAYPNPFDGITTLVIKIPDTKHVKLSINDMLGIETTVLVNKILDKGIYKIEWKPESGSSGLFIGKLSTGNTNLALQLIYAK